VTNTGGMTSTGDFAPAVIAQSIGGGGGLSTVTTDVDARILPLQGSLGTGCDARVCVGATGRDTTDDIVSALTLADVGDGKDVTVINRGGITTSGVFSHGLVGQSVGGGGGIMLLNGVGANATVYGGNAPESDVRPYVVQLGGRNVTGSGGSVSVTHENATISTGGAEAFGILAQSVGGGGGLFQKRLTARATPIVGGQPSAGTTFDGRTFRPTVTGSSGPVTVTLGEGSVITTAGTGAVGVLAQSIAGGGGHAGGFETVESAERSDDRLEIRGNTLSSGNVTVSTADGARTRIATTGAGPTASSPSP
jgi:hypothetical protein